MDTLFTYVMATGLTLFILGVYVVFIVLFSMMLDE
jgi:hypothetical protein